ncbi:MAG: serine protease [Bacteroidales bacterium]|nr:serine protease [Bacteroidales bacterium]
MKKFVLILLIFSTIVCGSCSRRGRTGSSYRRNVPIENTSNGSSRRAARHNRVQSQETKEIPAINDEKPLSVPEHRLADSDGSVLSGKQIYEKCASAVFMMITSTTNQRYQGSGFFISSTGTAVSNYHVFAGTAVGGEWILTTNGSQYKVKDVLYKSQDEDIIIFNVESKSNRFNYLRMASKRPSVGDKAYAIGSPRGLDNTLSDGMISQIRENDYLQISVPIDHGSSGGALLNEYGEVIGITSGGLDDSGANLNYAISIDVVKRHIR